MQVTVDDIAQLLASAPPRKVPVQVMQAAGPAQGQWFKVVFGLCFFMLGTFFTVVFFPWRFWDDWQLEHGAVGRTNGTVQRAEPSNSSINDTKVWEYEIDYTAADGRLRSANCYTSGPRWHEGQVVAIRYLEGRPEVAVADGARVNRGGLFGSFVILFPLIGCGTVASVVWEVVTRRRLLREGRAAEVEIISVDETTKQENYDTVYRIVMSSPFGAGAPPVTIKRVNKADVELALGRAREKQPVFVLYDTAHPTRMMFPEALIPK